MTEQGSLEATVIQLVKAVENMSHADILDIPISIENYLGFQRHEKNTELQEKPLIQLFETLFTKTPAGKKEFQPLYKQKMVLATLGYVISGVYKGHTYGPEELKKPFVVHTACVSYQLLEDGADYITVLAGLLHDAIETRMSRVKRDARDKMRGLRERYSGEELVGLEKRDKHTLLKILNGIEDHELTVLKDRIEWIVRTHLDYLNHISPKVKATVMSDIDMLMEVVEGCTKIVDDYFTYCGRMYASGKRKEVKERTGLVKIEDIHCNLRHPKRETYDNIQMLVKAIAIAEATQTYTLDPQGNLKRRDSRELEILLGTKRRQGTLYRMLDQASNLAQEVAASLAEKLGVEYKPEEEEPLQSHSIQDVRERLSYYEEKLGGALDARVELLDGKSESRTVQQQYEDVKYIAKVLGSMKKKNPFTVKTN